MATTFEVLHLGTAPEIDTTEGNVLSENDSALVGMTFGSADTPLAYNAQATLSPVSYAGGTSNMYDIDNTLSNDTFSIDGGTPQTFDGLAIYNATITYTDGTPDATITAVVIQDTAGNIYLVPETTANTDHAAMIAAPIESITLDSVYPISSGRLLADRQSVDFVCYAAETRILTDRGAVPAGALAPGARVVTVDRGLQTVRWVRRDTQRFETAAEEAKPVLIRAGALGLGRPAQDLVVSPQHRVLVGAHRQLCNLFRSEALVPAKSLTRLPGIRHMNGKDRITWVHFACDRHEVILANGCLAESLLIGPMVTAGLTASAFRELSAIFRRVPLPGSTLNGPPVRTCLSVGEARRRLGRPRGPAPADPAIRSAARDLAPARPRSPAGLIG